MLQQLHTSNLRPSLARSLLLEQVLVTGGGVGVAGELGTVQNRLASPRPTPSPHDWQVGLRDCGVVSQRDPQVLYRVLTSVFYCVVQAWKWPVVLSMLQWPAADPRRQEDSTWRLFLQV